MGSFNLTVVFLPLIIKLSSCSDHHTSVLKCIQTEREALLSFKEGLDRTDEYGWHPDDWVGEDCCQWDGVECNNKSGHVTKLFLKNWRLSGKISSSLIHLKYLNYLDFSGNNFTGIQIPQFFGMLENLMYLNLSYTYFSGEIPHLNNLSRLTHLDLSNSLTYAENLDWLSGLSSLKYLDMGHVDLSGVGANWLHVVNWLPSLVELYLDYCKLENLPTSLPSVNLTSLFVLDLSFNQFNSSIPQWLVNLTSLTTLDLHFNHFQDAIAFDFVNLRNLRDLYLSGNRYLTDLSQNNFCGTIDGFLGNASACLNKSLESLDLSYNNLLGKIPDSLGRLGSLRYLNLEYNSFWGSIPASIGSLSSLQDLDLSNNKMNGTIPESFGQLSKLVNLFLQENSWEGVITEAQLMNLTRLENVILKANTNHSLVFNVTYDWVPPFKLKNLELESCLCGPKFPIWLQVQSELTHVTLKNVGIIDTIPEEWFSIISSQIIRFDLSQNQIMGKLPHQLILPNVNFIDLSYNCFKGPIPLWFTNVTELYLKSNSFSGSIPSNIDDLMPRLRCLDLSENNLNGTIPLSIWKIKDLGGLYLQSNKLSGGLPDHWNESQPLWVVDIS
ncbi:receptor-like protein eix2 [Quercus suber]|uniref:Receptor-like protein eix2 n=1 Tax=Quercus suber TaxID=58331 RepID=A0AAW0KZB9_QUESU